MHKHNIFNGIKHSLMPDHPDGGLQKVNAFSFQFMFDDTLHVKQPRGRNIDNHRFNICLFPLQQNNKHELRRQALVAAPLSSGRAQRRRAVFVVAVSTFPAFITYWRIVLGSLMIDLGKARTAEMNFPIAR